MSKNILSVVVSTFMLFAFFSLIESCSVAGIKPNAFGNPGQVLVVAENDVWDGVVGEAFREYFVQPYPVLPQPEPYFEIKHVTGGDLKNLQREWKTIIFLGSINSIDLTSKYIKESLGQESTEKAKDDLDFNLAFRENLWADGQLVVYLFAPTEAQLIENIKTRFPQIEKRMLQVDYKLVKANTYQGGKNLKDIPVIKKTLGISLDLPIDFKIAVLDSVNQTAWLRRETRETSSNILIKVMDYTSESLVSEENMLSVRNMLGKEYITSAIEGAYMITDNVNLPMIFEETSINGNYALAARGIWAMENDFMGGSYVSYLVYNEEKQKVIFLDGFLYAPEQDKRPMMQRFEVIFSSLKI